MRTLLCWLSLVALAGAQSITLDPEEMETIKRQVFGEGATLPERAPLPLEQRWSQAMAAAGTDMQPVLLLALLQELNPQTPLTGNPSAYAAALKLHREAAAGNAEACEQLAQSLRCGILPGGLFILHSETLATRLLQHGRFFL